MQPVGVSNSLTELRGQIEANNRLIQELTAAVSEREQIIEQIDQAAKEFTDRVSSLQPLPSLVTPSTVQEQVEKAQSVARLLLRFEGVIKEESSLPKVAEEYAREYCELMSCERQVKEILSVTKDILKIATRIELLIQKITEKMGLLKVEEQTPLSADVAACKEEVQRLMKSVPQQNGLAKSF